MHESTGKSITQHITNNIFCTSNNVTKLTEKGSYPKSVETNYSYCDYLVPDSTNGRGPMTFDPFPKVQLIKKYIIRFFFKRILKRATSNSGRKRLEL